jgi:uncharacterized protein
MTAARQSSKPQPKGLPAMSNIEIVNKLLTNPVDIDNVRSLTTPDVYYVSLNKNHPDLTRILPWAGEHRGPEEIVKVFQGIYTMWEPVAFEVKAGLEQGEDVAMFGEFSYRSKETGKTVSSPFGVHLKVVGGKVSYILFLEDTLITTSSVQTGGEAVYTSLGKQVTLKG